MKKSGGLILAVAVFAMMTTGTALAVEPAQKSVSEQEIMRVLSPEGYKRAVMRTEYDKHTVGIDKFLELKHDPKAVILDLRDEKQYLAGHIRGAKHLGADVEDKKLAELVPDKTTPILLYCTNSLMLTRMISLTNVALPQILAHGYKNVFLLKDAASDRKAGEVYNHDDARLKKLDFVEQPTPAPQPTTGESKQ